MAMNFPGQIGSVECPKLPHVSKRLLAAKEYSAASRNRIRTCPQITQMDADEELYFLVCVNPRDLRAKAFSLVLWLLQEKILAPMRDSDVLQGGTRLRLSTYLLSLLKKMNLGQPGDASQFRLGGIASNEHLGADMLGGGNMNKIPSASMGALGVAGTQFIAPLQKIGQAMDFQPQLSRGFTGLVGVPRWGGIFAGESAKIVAQFNSQQRIPTKLWRAFPAPIRYCLGEFICRVKPCDQRGSIGVNLHRRRRCRSRNTGFGTRSLDLTLFCARQTSAMMSGQPGCPAAASGSIRPIVRPLRVISKDSPCSSWFKTILVSWCNCFAVIMLTS
jgi:hypothetical protein